MNAREPIIEVRDLANRFGEQAVHEHLDLTVYRGEILGVVGGSGTGKSVLLRSIVGLRRPSAGSVRVFGQDLLALPAGATLATGAPLRRAVPGRRAVFLDDGGREHRPAADRARALSREDATRLAAVKLALVGLSIDTAGKYPASLSGGMTKRAALARALALDPEVLFLDEPTAGLDPISAAAFDQLLLTLRNALGFTVFLVTHDLDTLYTTCDRVAVLSQKRVLVADTLDKVAATDDAWIQRLFPRSTRPRRAFFLIYIGVPWKPERITS